MPLYEYQCEACGKRFEAIQKFSDPAPETCRLCAKGPVKRLLSSPAIQFKGSGWYITDYAQKGKSDSSSTSSGTSEGDSGKSDGAKGEGAGGAAKTDTKTDIKTTTDSASTSSSSSKTAE